MTRRIQHQLPNLWDAWCAGDVDQEKVRRIDRGLRALVREDSIHILDQTVLDVAVCKTPELLGRWVNRLVARLEPGEHDSRHTLALSDRYASIRPDIDGVSFLSAAMSAMDANAIDRTLNECALACGAADPRTTQQRRADALVALLLGSTTAGCDMGAGTEAGAQHASAEPAGDLEADWDLPAMADKPCPNCHGQRRPRVDIGVVVPIQSLLGQSDAPGELSDRSATVPAHVVRRLAKDKDAVFWRLLTDPRGNLLEVTELGRFPTRKLRTAVTFRSATCDKPTCTVSAIRCDLDHHIPAPAGPTAAHNLDPKCRRGHRAKTHAGHHTARPGPQTTWTTPTGHIYTAADEPLPTATWTHHPIDLRWPMPKQRSIEESLADRLALVS